MPHGEMPEWSNGPPWKGGVRETVPRVRIPVSPPFYFFRFEEVEKKKDKKFNKILGFKRH